MKKIFKLIISLLIPILVAMGGSYFTSMSVDNWYQQINKPFFNPPGWLFGPVWTILYLMMGFSFYLIWKDDSGKDKGAAQFFFFLQLLFNFLWSLLFFGLRSPFVAFVDIVILWFAIILTIISFRKISRTAAYLLLPYLLWVSFAMILNISIFLIN
jgi:tryptophan-rich sensory protein